MGPILNFCRQEIVANTEEEARAKAPFFVVKNVTISYKKWREKQKGEITNNMVLTFLADFLYTHTRAVPGLGFIITVDKAIQSKRKKPFVVVIKQKRKGRTKYHRVYQLVDEDNNILDEVYYDKIKAMKRAKELVTLTTRGDITCRRMMIAESPDDIAFKVKYNRGKKGKKGVYIVFGIKKLID